MPKPHNPEAGVPISSLDPAVVETLHRTTAHLCCVLTYLSNHHPDIMEETIIHAESDEDGKGITDWYANHLEEDRKRAEREAKDHAKREKAKGVMARILKKVGIK